MTSLAKIHSKSHDEYGTPLHILQMAKEALGGSIHLDAASCEAAIRRTPTELIPLNYYSLENPAPERWMQVPTVWCNPPFSKNDQFLKSATQAALDGAVVMYLCPANMSTKYFQAALKKMKKLGLLDGLLFHSPRIPFHDMILDAKATRPSGHTCIFVVGDQSNPATAFAVKTLKEWGEAHNHMYMRM